MIKQDRLTVQTIGYNAKRPDEGVQILPEAKSMEHELIKPCIVCMAPNDVDAKVCSECGAVFGTPSMLRPGLVVTPEGTTWQDGHSRKAIVERPHLISVILSWVLMLPATAIAIIVAVDSALNSHRFEAFVFFWSGLGIALLFIAKIFSVTQNYFKFKKKRHKHIA